jgi:hypothetical protein
MQGTVTAQDFTSKALPFLWPAERYAATCERIRKIGVALAKVPPCESWTGLEDETAFGDCTQTLMDPGAPYLKPALIPWYHATDAQVAEFCAPCRARVLLWSQRREEKASLGGLKRSMMRAFRAWQATA